MSDAKLASAAAPSSDPLAAATVFYDGGCPVCRREIAAYRNRAGAEAMDWVDLTSAELPPGADREAMMARMHVRRRDGSMATGAAAFAAIWRGLERFRLAGRVADLPPLRWGLEAAYRAHLRLRPLWRRSGCPPPIRD